MGIIIKILLFVSVATLFSFLAVNDFVCMYLPSYPESLSCHASKCSNTVAICYGIHLCIQKLSLCVIFSAEIEITTTQFTV